MLHGYTRPVELVSLRQIFVSREKKNSLGFNDNQFATILFCFSDEPMLIIYLQLTIFA